MEYKEILKKLKSLANSGAVKDMARFGINPKNTLGISVYIIRDIAKGIEKDHKLAQQLWGSGIREAMILAGLVDKPDKVTEKQMEDWVKDFDSWDVCDSTCGNLFDKTKFAYQKAFEWSDRKEEFVKRAGFVLMATLALHDKKAKNKEFEQFFPVINKHSTDDRNFVKKAVNWALRQIGKRNSNLNKKAIEIAKKIRRIDSRSAKWIATDAIRELTSENIKKRLH